MSPANPAGTVGVVVSSRIAKSNQSGFTYLERPVVTSVNPASGPTAGGTTVTITGQNFASTSGGAFLASVKFGENAAASAALVSSTEIRAVSPPGQAGLVDVTVTTPGGTSPTSVIDAFRYEAAALPDLVVDDLTGGR